MEPEQPRERQPSAPAAAAAAVACPAGAAGAADAAPPAWPPASDWPPAAGAAPVPPASSAAAPSPAVPPAPVAADTSAAASLAPPPPLPPREATVKERARQREIASYLDAASIPASVGPPSSAAPPVLCRDPNITALAQLGALRLDTDRAFLSLIDGEYQYIVAEATRTHSLTKNGPPSAANALYLGVCKIELGWGVCPNTMPVFTDETGELAIRSPNIVADGTRYVIKNFLEDAHYRECEYVKGFPHMVSYAEVPLISPLGYILGSYCVVDNKPRDFDNDETIAILTDIATCTMAHLDLRRMEQNRARSEKLIKGLGVFMGRTGDAATDDKESDRGAEQQTDGNSLPPPSTIDLQEKSSDADARGSVRPTTSKIVTSESTISTQLSTTFSMGSPAASDSSTPATPLSTPPLPDSNPFEQLDKKEQADDPATPIEAPPKNDEEPVAKAAVPDTLVSADVRNAFSRAATLIKDAMHMDGLTFLDACPTGFASRSRNPTPQERGDPFLSDSTDDADDESVPSECATLGCSLRVRLCNNGDCNTINSDHPVALSEVLLHRIIRKYPRGTVLSADQEGFIDERTSPQVGPGEDSPGKRRQRRSRTSLDIAGLFRSIPGARSIIFLPLWHFQSESWFSATIGWTTDPTKAFEKCDLIYLSAFGNSVMAEVSRFEALAVSRSKSDFISSVSHELRSPLHGILASAELLRDSIKDPSQLHMLDMIESCGSTLLDTMNHILDFAKINNHLTAAPQGKPGISSIPSKAPLLTLVDLGTLVQDVVEAVYIGQNSRPMFRNRTFIESAVSPASEAGTPMLEGQDLPVIVTVDVQHDAFWEMDLEVGAWKRIVMNLFGNALKYTRSGNIQVGLHVVAHADRLGIKRDCICFSVNDTGIGMSPDYLKYRLFTPFAQENNLSTGTGLGLSIVKQIVNDLGGNLDVQSQIGVGTRVRVFVPLPEGTAKQPNPNAFHPPPTIIPRPIPQMPLSIFDPDKQLKGKAIYVIDPSNHSPRAELSLELRNAKHERARTVKATLDAIAPTWLGMDVVLAGDNVDDNADFYFVDWSVIDALSEQQLNIIMKSPKWKPLIVLCYGPPSNRTRSNLGQRNVVFLRHPIGPKKLTAALLGGIQGISKSPDAPPTVPDSAEQKAEPESLSLAPAQTAGTPVSTSTLQMRSGGGPGTLKVPLPQAFVLAPPRQHVLLVDDNEINLKILTTLVKKLGCTFEAATNGLEAVQRYKASARPFDFVFMDITMPVMNGFAATSDIRAFERNAHMQPTKVIALTGLGSAGSQQEAFASGADLFLTKPVSMKALRGLLAGDDGGVVPGGVGSPSGAGPMSTLGAGFFQSAAEVTAAANIAAAVSAQSAIKNPVNATTQEVKPEVVA